MIPHSKWLAVILINCLPLCAFAQKSSPRKTIERPPIVGVANIGLRTDNLGAAKAFYTGVLGFATPFTTPSDTPGAQLTYFKINEHQYVQLLPQLNDPKMDRLTHIGFETTNTKELRGYLASKGVKVPEKIESFPDGSLGFHVGDPDGHDVEFVQYGPASLEARNRGKFLPATRISRRMIHVGVVIQDRAAADRFYHDILGFHDIWHGGMKDDVTDWVDMRVPEGTDWLEYMLNVKNPDPQELGVMHHFALGVPSVKAGYQTAVKRGYKSQEEPEVGRDGKWQFNMYDPNYTRVELMEPRPVERPCCSEMKQ